jgi:hypothetical protein
MAHSSSGIGVFGMRPNIEEGNLSPKHSAKEARQPVSEDRAQSFIVKVWCEEAAKQGGRTTWRGRITHVPGGERRYLQNLSDIARFIAPYLGAMGVRPGVRERIKRWLPLLKLFSI